VAEVEKLAEGNKEIVITGAGRRAWTGTGFPPSVTQRMPRQNEDRNGDRTSRVARFEHHDLRTALAPKHDLCVLIWPTCCLAGASGVLSESVCRPSSRTQGPRQTTERLRANEPKSSFAICISCCSGDTNVLRAMNRLTIRISIWSAATPPRPCPHQRDIMVDSCHDPAVPRRIPRAR